MFRKFWKEQSPAKPKCLDNIQLKSSLQGNEKCRGIALIASNNYEGTDKPLPSTDKDSDDIERFFKALGNYEVVTPEKNLKANEFMNICEHLASLQYPETYKRLVIYFAGHGGNGYITMIDKPVHVDDLQAIFDPVNNDTLNHMAKIFIIDACRGSACYSSHTRGPGKGAKPYQAQCRYSNQLMVYSTLEGQVAHNDIESYGGLWTHTFHTCLIRDKYMYDHLCDVLTHVNGYMDERGLQIAPHQSTLSGDFIYFWIEAGTCITV